MGPKHCKELWSGTGAAGRRSWLLCSLLFQLHAEYSREKDAYLPHRVVQAWELAQFIR